MVSWLKWRWVARPTGPTIYPNSPVVPLLGSLSALYALLSFPYCLSSLALFRFYHALLSSPLYFIFLASPPLSPLISLLFAVALQLALVIGGSFRHPGG